MLSAAAIRSVAIGIVGTAIIQSSLGGLGLVVAGVPGTEALVAVMVKPGMASVNTFVDERTSIPSTVISASLALRLARPIVVVSKSPSVTGSPPPAGVTAGTVLLSEND